MDRSIMAFFKKNEDYINFSKTFQYFKNFKKFKISKMIKQL